MKIPEALNYSGSWKKEETEEQNAYIQCNYIKSKEFIIQETASDVVTEPRVGPG